MKNDMTLHALYIMKKILENTKRSSYVRTESWTETEGRTIKVMMEFKASVVTYP